MTLFGVVCDALNPAGCPDPEALSWAEVVRLTASDSQQLYGYAKRLQAAGIKVALVWTLASVGNHPDPEVVRRIVRRCPAEFHVVGNEPDSVYNLDADGNPYPSEASDGMAEQVFGPWFHAVATAIRTIQPDTLIILAGMVSGQPWAARKYVDAVRRSGHRLDGLDLHLYNTTPGELGTKLNLYREEFPTLALYMSEWSRPASEIWDFMQGLESFGVAMALYHAWHQTDIEGLHDESGHPTDRHHAYLAALAARPFAGSGNAATESNTEGENVMKIEERDQQSDFPLGNRWAETGKTWKAHDVGGGVRLAGYDRGVLIEIDGACWQAPHVEQLPNP
jgi:hypothetical protein